MGQGTTLYFLCRARGESRNGKSDDPNTHLVVDDEPLSARPRSAHCNRLCRSFHLQRRERGEMVAPEQPDLVCWMLSIRRGGRLRRCPPGAEFSDVPIIMLTASARGRPLRGFDAGADDYTSSPSAQGTVGGCRPCSNAPPGYGGTCRVEIVWAIADRLARAAHSGRPQFI